MKSKSSPSDLLRREFLKLGTLSAFGISLSNALRGWLRAEQPQARRAKSCILIWLDGGPSHLDSFDPKPQAPAEIRGPFPTITTAIPGVALSELLPQTAKIIQQIAIIRSVTSPLGEHNFGAQYLLTGYKPTPAVDYPTYGATVAHLNERDSELPTNIAVPHFRVGGGKFPPAGFLSPSCAPFQINADPARDDFQIRDAELPLGMTKVRLDRRREFLRYLDRFDDKVSQVAPVDEAFEQAYRLMTSEKAKKAFRLSDEPESVRRRYGSKTIGQSCLLARRLVESGVPFVTVNCPGWDTHENLYTRLKEGYTGARIPVGLLPSFDTAFSALIRDLLDRRLLDETLVIAMGEFGRTPKLNPSGGRDHWPRVFSVIFAGAGIPGGQIIGSSDSMGESPIDRPVTPADLAASVYTLLGIEPSTRLWTPDGRPVPVVSDGNALPELVR